MSALETEAAKLREALALADALSGIASPEGEAADPGNGNEPGNRPARIRRILRDRQNAPTKPGVLKRTMVERGWLAPGEDRLFYSALSTMNKREHLLRTGDGRYLLSAKGIEMDED